MKRLQPLSVLVFCLLAIPNVHAQTKKITAAEAKDHIGDRATVCGKIASTHYAKSSKGEPTFLHLNEPYPKENSSDYCAMTVQTTSDVKVVID